VAPNVTTRTIAVATRAKRDIDRSVSPSRSGCALVGREDTWARSAEWTRMMGLAGYRIEDV
jgi:hypothetical protein